ncbi:MAG: hypothetical protein GXP39_19450 [Chloroflexi bacterium]|nr:hypothetical protein [Chloroflexota bacterium]
MTASTTSTIAQRVWNYCHDLRDDSVSYGDDLREFVEWAVRVCLKNAVASVGGSPSGENPSFALDLLGLGLGPSGRAERDRYRPERWDFCGREAPSTPPPVELAVEGASSKHLAGKFSDTLSD